MSQQKIIYFCRSCEQVLFIHQFRIVKSVGENKQIFQCLLCHQNSIKQQCKECQAVKFQTEDSEDCIFQCLCGYKKLIYNCVKCGELQKIENQLLKQTSEIECLFCQKHQYQVNCPECKNQIGLDSIKNQITCSKCNYFFFVKQCEKCQSDSFSKDCTISKQFICNIDRKHKENCYQCLNKNCNTFNKIQSGGDIFSCQKCNNKQRLLICLCGEKYFIQITQTNTQEFQFKCKNCMFDYKTVKCNTNNCSGTLLFKINQQNSQSQIESGDIKSRLTSCICYKCRNTKRIQSCMKCHKFVILSDNQELAKNCASCQFQYSEGSICSICYTNQVDTVLIPCMHAKFCLDCLQKQKKNECPVCKTAIQQKSKIYL